MRKRTTRLRAMPRIRNRRLLALAAVGVACALGAPSTALGGFAPAQNYPTGGSSPDAVAIADFNGDGRRDLAVVNGCCTGTIFEGVIGILLNNGNGTFGAPTTFNAGSTPESIAVADFNADGRLDLVTANNFSDTVSVLLGNGDGTFQARVPYGAGNYPTYVVAADFNADGKVDIAVANLFGHNVSILLGNGNGTFQPHVTYPTGQTPIALAVGDVNNDGKLDLVTVNNNDRTISVLLGNGNGSFQAPINTPGNLPGHVALADFNGDGRLDLAVGDAGTLFTGGVGARLEIRFGNGNGTFQPPTSYPVGTGGNFVAVGDFNLDGKPDVAVANVNSFDVSVLINRGDGTFGPTVNYRTGDGPIWVAVGDVNADTRPDLAVVNARDGTVSVLLNVRDVTRPQCVVQISANQIRVTLTEPESGIAQITRDIAVNATVTGAPATPNPAPHVAEVVATRIDRTRPMRLQITATNTEGLATTCDPVLSTLRVRNASRPTTQTFAYVPRAESKATVKAPGRGVRRVVFELNGQVFPVDMRGRTVARLSLARAMRHLGNNVVHVKVYGRVGARVTIMLSD